MKSAHRRFNVSIIGAGKVGTTLANLLYDSRNNIVAIVSRNIQSARKCGKHVSCRNCSSVLSAIPGSTDLVIIAVPDQAIRSVAESLGSLSHLDFHRMAVCHTSGAMTSDVLEPVGHLGSNIFSVHPIQTFPRQNSLKDQARSMKGITYGVEGPKNSLVVAKRLVKQMGGRILLVPKEAKILYHLACVIASNYSIALIAALESVAGKFAGTNLAPFEDLLRTSLENGLKFGAREALTGPIVRGDDEVVAAHLSSIQEPELQRLYKSLGSYALEMVVDRGGLKPDQISRLRELFDNKG